MNRLRPPIPLNPDAKFCNVRAKSVDICLPHELISLSLTSVPSCLTTLLGKMTAVSFCLFEPSFWREGVVKCTKLYRGSVGIHTGGGTADGLFSLSATSVSLSLLVCQCRGNEYKSSHSYIRSYLTFVEIGVMD